MAASQSLMVAKSGIATATFRRFGSVVLEVKCLDSQTASTLFAHYRYIYC